MKGMVRGFSGTDSMGSKVTIFIALVSFVTDYPDAPGLMDVM